MGPVPGVCFNVGLPEFANRFELPEELPEPILITVEEAQQKLRELGVSFPAHLCFLFTNSFLSLAFGGLHLLH